MHSPHNIEQIISMYWEAERSGVKQRYESLFGQPVDVDDANIRREQRQQDLPTDEIPSHVQLDAELARALEIMKIPEQLRCFS